MPGAVPIFTPGPPVATPVSEPVPPQVTDRIRLTTMPVATSGARRGLVIALAAGGALAAAAITYVVLANDAVPTRASTRPTEARSIDAAGPEPSAAPIVEPAAPVAPVTPPVDAKPVPPVSEPAKPALAEKPKPADKPRARKPVKKAAKPAKDPSWNPDSPFMPVPVKK